MLEKWRVIAAKILVMPIVWGALGANGPLWTPQNVNARLLAAHNNERARLGIPPLKWNDKLAQRAAQWAEELTTMNELEHADEADYEEGGEVEGENLWRGTRDYFTPEQMVNLWVDERKIFINGPFPHNATNGRWRDVGHYTQLIWKSTTEVGCAIAHNNEDEILVCRYVEGGNVMGEKPY
jgi:hypothetical protein